MENKQKGIFLILMSAIFFALMAATVKYLDSIPVYEKIFFRNILGFIIALFIVIKRKKSILGNNKRFLILRSIFGLLGVSAYFIALSNIPLADTVILNKISPFFVMILSVSFLNEKINKYQILALIIALIGASFVIKPKFEVSIIPYITALLSALFAGSAYTTVKYLSKTDAPETIVLYFTVFSTIVTIPFMVKYSFIIPTTEEALGLLALGLFATSAQFLMTNAYRFAPAGELSIYTYTNIIFSSILGFFIWQEIPDTLSVFGGILIIIAGYINYRSKTFNKNSI